MNWNELELVFKCFFDSLSSFICNSIQMILKLFAFICNLLTLFSFVIIP